MPTEPRYTIIDNETGRSIAVSTDELQVLYWLAENEAERLRKNDHKKQRANNPLPQV